MVILDTMEEAAQETAGDLYRTSDNTKHTSFAVNVASKEQIVSALQKTRDVYSRSPCIVVNAAGIIRDTMMVKMPEERFDEVIGVNLKVSLHALQHWYWLPEPFYCHLIYPITDLNTSTRQFYCYSKIRCTGPWCWSY